MSGNLPPGMLSLPWPVGSILSTKVAYYLEYLKCNGERTALHRIGFDRQESITMMLLSEWEKISEELSPGQYGGGYGFRVLLTTGVVLWVPWAPRSFGTEEVAIMDTFARERFELVSG